MGISKKRSRKHKRFSNISSSLLPSMEYGSISTVSMTISSTATTRTTSTYLSSRAASVSLSRRSTLQQQQCQQKVCGDHLSTCSVHFTHYVKK
uniref:Uncharacterized protein n=1 Tax=Ditylenchus dipsaci TaxID=166011 RepID=A0A915EB89_9BILA